MEVKAAEDVLKKISDRRTRLQMEGVQLYSQILLLLNDSQKAKVKVSAAVLHSLGKHDAGWRRHRHAFEEQTEEQEE